MHNFNTQSSLRLDFIPGIDHVIIGKGKKYSNHCGNLRLRELVLANLNRYASARSKAQKSTIIWEIIDIVRSSTDESGFIQHDKATGRWCYAGDSLARERVSQVFRDALHLNYKSSGRSRWIERAQKRRAEAITRKQKLSQQSWCTGEGNNQHSHPDKKPLLSYCFGLMTNNTNSASMTKTKSLSKLNTDISCISITPCSSDIDLSKLLDNLLSEFSEIEDDQDPFEPVPIRDNTHNN